MPIQMALRPKARICGAYPAIGYGRINVFGHGQTHFKSASSMREGVLKNLFRSIIFADVRFINGDDFSYALKLTDGVGLRGWKAALVRLQDILA